jgi:hypothetical protein
MRLFPAEYTRGPGGVEHVFLARDSPPIRCTKPQTALIAAVLAPIGQEHHHAFPSLETLYFQRFRMAIRTYQTTLRRTGSILFDHKLSLFAAFAVVKRIGRMGPEL